MTFNAVENKETAEKQKLKEMTRSLQKLSPSLLEATRDYLYLAKHTPILRTHYLVKFPLGLSILRCT